MCLNGFSPKGDGKTGLCSQAGISRGFVRFQNIFQGFFKSNSCHRIGSLNLQGQSGNGRKHNIGKQTGISGCDNRSFAKVVAVGVKDTSRASGPVK